MTAFDAVIFDCDGVLVASERLINRVEAGLLAGLGLRVSPDDTRTRFKGHTLPEVVSLLEAEIAARLPVDWGYEWGMHTALGFVKDLRAVPGVHDVLVWLAGRGIPVGVASQAPPVRVELCLHIADLTRYFDDRVFTAAQVPRAKPCPDVFLLASARMGVEPGRCAVIEDSPSGAAAAVAAGMAVFGYAADEDAQALAAAGATVFHDMRALPALLESAERRDAVAEGDGLRDAYARFVAGDPGAMVDFVADDAVYHLPGGHLGGGTLRGRTEILERTMRAVRSCDAPPVIELLGLAGTPDTLLSVERITMRRRGRVLDQKVCVVWRMADGRCTEIWSRFADQRACDRFWAEV